MAAIHTRCRNTKRLRQARTPDLVSAASLAESKLAVQCAQFTIVCILAQLSGYKVLYYPELVLRARFPAFLPVFLRSATSSPKSENCSSAVSSSQAHNNVRDRDALPLGNPFVAETTDLTDPIASCFTLFALITHSHQSKPSFLLTKWIALAVADIVPPGRRGGRPRPLSNNGVTAWHRSSSA